jgi:hypothetical protein
MAGQWGVGSEDGNSCKMTSNVRTLKKLAYDSNLKMISIVREM